MSEDIRKFIINAVRKEVVLLPPDSLTQYANKRGEKLTAAEVLDCLAGSNDHNLLEILTQKLRRALNKIEDDLN